MTPTVTLAHLAGSHLWERLLLLTVELTAGQVNRLSQAHLAVSVQGSLSTVDLVQHRPLLVLLVLLALASTRILAVVALAVE
jgi:hypothetical protein